MFKITDENVIEIMQNFADENFATTDNDDSTLYCSCTGGCGGNCIGGCAGSCRGDCTFSCSRYNR